MPHYKFIPTITTPGTSKQVVKDHDVDVLKTLGASIDRDWFQVDVQVRSHAAYLPGGISAGTVRHTFTDILGDSTQPLPTTPITFAKTVTLIEDAVVYVIIRRRGDTLALSLSTEEISYGTHPAVITSRRITLAQARATCLAVNNVPGATLEATNPANVSIEVLNTTGAGWTLEVYSQPHNGNDGFARMLYVGTQEIFGPANITPVFNGNGSTQQQTIGWNQLLNGGVAVDIGANSIGMVGSVQRAVLVWNLIGEQPQG